MTARVPVAGAPQPTACDPLSYLEAHAARRPDAAAIWQDGETTTFAQLRARVWALVAALRARGIGPGSVVAVALPNIAPYVALELAVPAAGATLFPLPVGIGARELSSVLQRSQTRLLVVDASQGGEAIGAVAAGIDTAPEIVTAAALAPVGDDPAPPRPERVAPDPERIVQIALTSGTTGMPKLASLSARLKQLTFEGFTDRLQITADDRMMPLSPITQGVGEMCLYALRCGAAMVMSGPERFDPERALRTAAASAATVIGAVPTMLGRMVRQAELDAGSLPRLRLTVSAGAPLAPSLAREWERRTARPVGSFYGAMDIGQLSVASPQDPAEKRWTTVGRPHDAAEWRICGPDGRDLAVGEAGDICMRGPLVQDAYWGESTGPHAADGWAHFGDLGFVDADGYLHITGRVKDTIIRGANNINPLEVEELIRHHPDVSDVCVVGRPDPDLGERAVAYVVRGGEDPMTRERLAEFLSRQGLTRYKWPEAVTELPELPMGATGKVDRATLRRRAATIDAEEIPS